MKRLATLLVLAALAGLGCRQSDPGQIHDVVEPDYDRQLPPGELALRRIEDPNRIPDFTPALQNPHGLRRAIANSLNYLAKPSSRRYYPYGRISHAHVTASLEAFDALLASGQTPEQLNRAIREQFDVYISVGCDNEGTVLYTGYYTPIFDAAEQRTERFRYPLYRPPANLVKNEEGDILGVRTADGAIVPAPTRREYETTHHDALQGRELVWLDDPFKVYVAHVQGSALLRMPDGSTRGVGYAASNGREYNSIAAEMVDDGEIEPDEISLQTMMDYFEAHPEKVHEYVYRNGRFVFFTESDRGAVGSINEPVIAWRSIATDKSIYPRAALAMIDAELPRRVSSGVQVLPFRGFVCDQDTGGAIRAPGRCDIYMGVGRQAQDLAGRTRQEGRLYYLMLKPARLTQR